MALLKAVFNVLSVVILKRLERMFINKELKGMATKKNF
jgi:hypothetical protein